MKYKLLLLLIILIGFFLRVYRLSGTPPVFWQDIAADSYDAYSILKTGKDHWGNTLPFPLIKSLGDYKTALPVYFLIPGIFVFGLNEFGVRINTVIIGTITILIIYLFGKRFKNETLGLTAAFFLSISPWHIGLNRHGWEVSIGILLFLTGFYFLVGNKKRIINIFLCVFFLALSSYSYHSYRIFVPLFFIISFIYLFFKKNITKKVFIISIFLFFLFFLPNLISLASFEGRIRAEVNRFDKSSEFIKTVDVNLSACKSSKFNFICNQESVYIFTAFSRIFKNYFSIFSLDFLFVSAVDPIFEIKDRGVFYIWILPLFIFGLYTLIRSKEINNKLILFWLLLWPVPATIVNSPYNLIKTAHIIPLFEIVSAVGFGYFLPYIKKIKLLAPVIVIIIFASVSKYFVDYYSLYPNLSNPWYQDIEKRTFQSIDRYKSLYKKIILSQKLEPYIYLLFYEKTDPNYFQNTNDKMFSYLTEFKEVHYKKIGKFEYSKTIGKINVNTLYAFPRENIKIDKNLKIHIYDVIKNYNNQDMIYIFSYKNI